MLSFINQDRDVARPDGTRGAGLFAYLRALTATNGDRRRDVIATVFKGVQNRMINGYLLRDLLNKVDGIHFTSSDELHTLGSLYESMLREMRDAAGDSGEFYTPRAVVRFMVRMSDPRLGERVLDPASGTGGFLVEAFEHMRGQVNEALEQQVPGYLEANRQSAAFGFRAVSFAAAWTPPPASNPFPTLDIDPHSEGVR